MNNSTNISIPPNTLTPIILLTEQINELTTEKTKEEFVKNYSNIKNQIELTDSIINLSLDDDYKSKSIGELYELVDSYNWKLSNPKNLESRDICELMSIIKILEEKLNGTMNLHLIK